MKTKVTYKGVEFDILYDYYPATQGDDENPSFPEEILINEIFHKGESFLEILEDRIPEIEKEIFEKSY